jgi:DNA-binding beta-propeller fold protein YncE
VAAAPDGTVYLLQRGAAADPVVAVAPDGTVRRAWGRGRFVMPHAIRVDPQGHVWTTDAASSHVRKFTADGRELLDIAVGGQPSPCRNNFCGTTDVAFAPDGHVFVADGYANARVIEFTAEGRKVREWGSAGTGPGQFNLPHSLQIDGAGVIYVADRENGRIQRFDRTGRFLGAWKGFGKTFGLKSDGAALWLATQPRQQPNLSPGWLLKVDTASGRLLGWAPSEGNHGMDVLADGTLLLGPGPGATAQRYRPLP